MLDLSALLDDITFDEPQLEVDRDFIIRFLAPYFPHLDTSELEAKLTDVMSSDPAARGR